LHYNTVENAQGGQQLSTDYPPSILTLFRNNKKCVNHYHYCYFYKKFMVFNINYAKFVFLIEAGNDLI